MIFSGPASLFRPFRLSSGRPQNQQHFWQTHLSFHGRSERFVWRDSRRGDSFSSGPHSPPLPLVRTYLRTWYMVQVRFSGRLQYLKRMRGSGAVSMSALSPQSRAYLSIRVPRIARRHPRSGNPADGVEIQYAKWADIGCEGESSSLTVKHPRILAGFSLGRTALPRASSLALLLYSGLSTFVFFFLARVFFLSLDRFFIPLAFS